MIGVNKETTVAVESWRHAVLDQSNGAVPSPAKSPSLRGQKLLKERASRSGKSAVGTALASTRMWQLSVYWAKQRVHKSTARLRAEFEGAGPTFALGYQIAC